MMRACQEILTKAWSRNLDKNTLIEMPRSITGLSLGKNIVLLLILTFLTASYVITPLPANADYVPQSSSTLNLSSEFGVSWAGDDVAYAMTPIDSENSTLLAGYTTSFGAGGSDVWLVKVTSRLNYLNGEPWIYRDMVDWRRTYGGAQDDGARSLIQASDGRYIIAGYTKSYGAGGFDMYLLKVDSDGDLLWNWTYGGSQDDGANCIVPASDGGYIIAGYTNSDVQSQSAWLVKTDLSGQMQWNRTVPGMEVNSIMRTKDNGYVLATKSFAGFELVKLDSMGQVQWNQTYAALDLSEAESAVQTSDGGYAVAGWENVSQTSTSARLIKTDSSGNVQWDETYPGLGAYAMIQTSSGGYALTGDRAFLIITDSSGHVQWNRNYDALSEDNLHFTRTYYIAEPSPNQFVMAGTQQSYGQILTGLDGRMIKVTLRWVEDTTPPKITVLSPENKIYTTSDVPLIFKTDKPAVWMAYQIDNGRNVTVSGNTTITLLDGWHNITVYAAGADYNNGASETVHFSKFAVDSVPLNVKVHSIQNTTYASPDLPLVFSVDKLVSWVGYSLDGQANVTIAQNVTLAGLVNGAHTLTVYAKDTIGLSEASDSINFAVSDLSPADIPSEFSGQYDPTTPNTDRFPPTLVAAACAGSFAIIGASLLIYFKKRKH
jgi:hypothetical protein